MTCSEQKKGACLKFRFHKSLGRFGRMWKVFPLDSIWDWSPMLCVLFSQWTAGPDPAAGLPAHCGLRHLLQLLLLGLHCEEHHGVRWRRWSSLWMPGEHLQKVSKAPSQISPLSAYHFPHFPYLLFHTYTHIQIQLSTLVSVWKWFFASNSMLTGSQSWKKIFKMHLA